MTAPIIVNLIILYFEDPKHKGSPVTWEEWKVVLTYLGSITGIRLTIAWITAINSYHMERIGINATNMLVTAIYKKSLKFNALTTTDVTTGKLVNLI